jgi:phosphoglycolate phosphatase
MERALHGIFGTKGDDDYHYDGKTDKQIVRELMHRAGKEPEHVEERMQDLLDSYLFGLNDALKMEQHRIMLYPGIPEILDALESQDDIILGLLTGNIEAGARKKLIAAGLDPDRFRVNAFGSDHAHRPELPAIAQRRAKEMLGVDLQGDRIVVIGDTPADIECGRSIGARAIGVATGRFSVDELAAHSPYAVFQDLSDTPTVLQTILDA